MVVIIIGLIADAALKLRFNAPNLLLVPAFPAHDRVVKLAQIVLGRAFCPRLQWVGRNRTAAP
jgi:hypothetical protein